MAARAGSQFSTQLDATEQEDEGSYLFGNWDEVAKCSFVWAASDASGGKDTSDPKLRRVGWSAVVFSPELIPLAGIAGGLTGPRQTVPQGELRAIRRLAEAIPKGTRFHLFSDCTAMVEAVTVGGKLKPHLEADRRRRKRP